MSLLKQSGVYFVTYAEHPEFVKIGIARVLKERLSSFKTHTPWTTTVLYFIPATYKVDAPLTAKMLEKNLHDRFANQRHVGEWFHYDGELKEYLEEQDFDPIYFT
jgi:hypothetical protein